MADRDTTDPLARDIERIHALRDQGRLTSDEAERLIGVLRGHAVDPDAADAAKASEAPTPTDATDAADAADAPRVPRVPPVPPAPPAPPEPSVHQEPKAPTPPSPAPRPTDDMGIVWLTTEMLAADLVVEVASGLTEPRLRTPVEDAKLTAEGGHWRLRYRNEWSNWSFFGGRGSPERIEVEVPEAMGVHLDVKAGDVAIRGVSHVRGRMLAGDLTIDGASFVDVDKKAGDFEARIRPTAGKQRLVAKAGDLDVVLLPGSDVRVSASVNVGDLRIDGFDGSRESQGIGHRKGLTLGEGTAELELRLTAGSLTLTSEA